MLKKVTTAAGVELAVFVCAERIIHAGRLVAAAGHTITAAKAVACGIIDQAEVDAFMETEAQADAQVQVETPAAGLGVKVETKATAKKSTKAKGKA